ncbi:hypothetical protein [Ornithinibacillus californiensis]|uniref:hypothetical protein n=1 Tax=Ornithinibacillus californiensis TaxID=161536 RepID=UPI00064DF8CF|nr:hypothetical protein [Ornithinibacillus californiensis]
MEKGIAYTLVLIFLSIVLFLVVTSILKTSHPSIVFFLSIITSHLILEKNQWVFGKSSWIDDNSDEDRK